MRVTSGLLGLINTGTVAILNPYVALCCLYNKNPTGLAVGQVGCAAFRLR